MAECPYRVEHLTPKGCSLQTRGGIYLTCTYDNPYKCVVFLNKLVDDLGKELSRTKWDLIVARTALEEEEAWLVHRLEEN